jgi:hypothetical protein
MDNTEKFERIMDGQVSLPPDAWFDTEMGTGAGEGCLADQFSYLNGCSELGSIAIQLSDDLREATEELARHQYPDGIHTNEGEEADYAEGDAHGVLGKFVTLEYINAEAREEQAEKLFMTFDLLYNCIEEEVANAGDIDESDGYDEAIVRGTEAAIKQIHDLRDIETMTELEADGAISYINTWAMQYRLVEPHLHFAELRQGS